jgi:hypothetical protein
VGATGAAFRSRGRPEAHIAVAVVIAAMVTPFVQSSTFGQTEFGILVVDVSLLAILLKKVLTTDRLWVVFAAGFQLATVLMHAAYILTGVVDSEAYAAAAVFWAYLVLFSLALGSLRLIRQGS